MASVRARPSLHRQFRRGRVRQLIARRRRLVTAALVGIAAAGLPSPVIASSGGGRRITDAENTRTVYLVVALLVLLAIGLAVFTWWFWRSTRRDHEALAPLEVMSDRKFLASDGVARQVLLDGNRPVGAAPLVPGAPEPLLVPADGEEAAEADDAPATLVVAAVGAGAAVGAADGDVDVASERTEPPAATDDDATTVVPVQDGNLDEADAVGADDGGEVASDVAGVVPAAPLVGSGDDDEQSGPDPVADGDATMAIDVTVIEAPVAAIDAPAHVQAPSMPTDDPPRAATNGSAPVPIDPGLPVPPVEEPVRQLSLAELAALEADSPVGFDEDELASTPSTGIPVIESAEAWVERQLAGRNGGMAHGSGIPGAGERAGGAASAAGEDPDEPTPAALSGAD